MKAILYRCGWAGLGGLVLIAVFSPWIAPHSVVEMNLSHQLEAPSWTHWLGLNQNGTDLLSLVMYGARVSLLVGIVSSVISLTLGTFVGLITGYLGGPLDLTLSRIIDIVLAFPGMLLAIAIAAVLGPSVVNVIVALTVGGWVPFARLVRGEVLSLRERPFVAAARAAGAKPLRVMLIHILPNLWGPLVVQFSFAVAAAILAESSLSFLGLGASASTPSWGSAVSDGTRYLLVAPHLATFPGVAIMITVLSLNLVGDGLRDRLLEE